MSDFITAFLEKNEVGSMDHDDNVYDRWLTFRLQDNQKLRAMDEGCFCKSIAIEQSYKVIFNVANHSHLSMVSKSPNTLNPGEWFGKVVDLNWNAPQISYQSVHPFLHRCNRLLVDSPFGWILMSASKFKEAPYPGSLVVFKPLRWEILAIF